MRFLASLALASVVGTALFSCASNSKPSPSEPTNTTPTNTDAGAEVDADGPAVDEIPEEFRELDAYLANATVKYKFQSGSFGVLRKGELVFFHGYGLADENLGTPVARDTVYRFGSITKVLTSTVILSLRDEGKLKLDDPLEKYLPEAKKIVYPNGDADPRITIAQILTHTSGMPRLGKVDYTRSDRDVTEEELLGELDGLVLTHVPGTNDEYSNLAVALLGPVIARVAGTSYEEAVQKRVLDPLGMKSVWRREDVKGPLALGHHVDGKKVVVDPPHWRMGAYEAAGGLYGSLDDLFRLGRFGLEGPADGKSPLSLATLRDAQTVHDGTTGAQGTGYIWVVTHLFDDPFVWHNGSTLDYSSMMMLDPKNDVGFVTFAASWDEKQSLDTVAVTAMRWLVAGEALPKK